MLLVLLFWIFRSNKGSKTESWTVYSQRQRLELGRAGQEPGQGGDLSGTEGTRGWFCTGVGRLVDELSLDRAAPAHVPGLLLSILSAHRALPPGPVLAAAGGGCGAVPAASPQ